MVTFKTIKQDNTSEAICLERYPLDKTGNLQAWDAADSYLLNTLLPELESNSNIAVLHDNFGALTLPLLDRDVMSYGDSWMSRHAIEQNMAINNIQGPLPFENDVMALCQRPERPDYIVGRVPKSKLQLGYLLSQLRGWANDGCQLYLGGMDKHLGKGQFDQIAKYFGESGFLPAVKKARVWHARVDKQIETFIPSAQPLKLKSYDLTLRSLPNVFSSDRVDIGTRFLLDNFSQLPKASRVADLACGAGIIGLCYMRRYADAELHFYDESYQAIASTQNNLRDNFSDRKAKLHVGDGLKSADNGSFELVLSNPPFHQFNAVNKSIAKTFFQDSHRCLQKEGELWIVANRHLGYHSVIKQVFGHCDTVVGNRKFVILRAVRQK